MTILSVLTYPDPVLSKKALPLDLSQGVTKEIQNLVHDMAETMYSMNGIGLAAPQVGISLQIIVIDLHTEKNMYSVYINPRIIRGTGKVSTQEGCLSVPFIFDYIPRYKSIEFEYFDLEGHAHVCSADNLLSICLQHEIDHLEGKVIFDRMSRLKKKLALVDYERSAKRSERLLMKDQLSQQPEITIL